ncbi:MULTISPECIES: TetR/AcrR family transcriptional regulator [unclassified Streptomyces]|uniref:TetR/AcrR family transcriptional regulator n=1 Tax=unclassified Streptomyces TaxID=2593676 RepID=UPI00081EF593|nr:MULTISPECIES: TetR/AcrR family transcriptional regulator [unclassified Streptomyces]MYR30109.1 TetR family transcriptional regulator [Streptomyces sp. SID4945]SCF48716.1 transcriptional regulator, TetR family [Streptomyces sp. LcepLS]
MSSLRERKKAETRRKLREVALDLFAERGFDAVSVAEIAEAAGFSKMTVFNYFGSKEDLVLQPLQEHVEDAARAVRERASGESAVAALRRTYLSALAAGDASLGGSDLPLVLRLQGLIASTPPLLARVLVLRRRSERALAAELTAATGDDAGSSLAAAQILAVWHTLVGRNFRGLLAGIEVSRVIADGLALAERAFGQLESGLGDFGRAAPGRTDAGGDVPLK